MPATKLSPFTEALGKLAERLPQGADLSSSEWADVPLALRERAFFSARVTNAGYLQEIKERVGKILEPRTVLRDGRPVTEGMNLATARAELKQVLNSIGYDPGAAAGGLQDLGSDARLELQLKQNVQSAQGYGNFLQGQAEGALDAFPAQELFRAEARAEPRDWAARWMQAGGQIFSGGRMIALKNDPLWSAISEFDTPYPPFDYNSGMWVRDVDRAEAIALGLLEEGQTAEPAVEDFNARLQASVRDLSPDLLDSLSQTFGPRITIQDGLALWT